MLTAHLMDGIDSQLANRKCITIFVEGLLFLGYRYTYYQEVFECLLIVGLSIVLDTKFFLQILFYVCDHHLIWIIKTDPLLNFCYD